MKPCEPNPTQPAVDHLKNMAAAEARQWRMARNRVLQYLDALGMPAFQSLELSLQVLQTSRERYRTEGRPVEIAMQTLFGMLSEDAQTAPLKAGRMNLHSAAVPALNRGKMVPEQPGFSQDSPVPEKQNRTHGRTGRVSSLLRVLVLFFALMSL